MTTLSRYLTDDHAHCDGLFAEAENAVAESDWPTAELNFEHFLKATLRHFEREETILFPPFEERTGMTQGPTQVMRNEHDQIQVVMNAMAEALGKRDQGDFLGHSETLLMLLRQHNLKEEQILYPMTERTLADETAVLLSRMQNLRE
jgi:hemerythrin-like domain-containing protein